jgi:hypothetical protein
MKLLLKNLLFTILIPGIVAVYLPLMITRRNPSLIDTGWRRGIMSHLKGIDGRLWAVVVKPLPIPRNQGRQNPTR